MALSSFRNQGLIRLLPSSVAQPIADSTTGCRGVCSNQNAKVPFQSGLFLLSSTITKQDTLGKASGCSELGSSSANPLLRRQPFCGSALSDLVATAGGLGATDDGTKHISSFPSEGKMVLRNLSFNELEVRPCNEYRSSDLSCNFETSCQTQGIPEYGESSLESRSSAR